MFGHSKKSGQPDAAEPTPKTPEISQADVRKLQSTMRAAAFGEIISILLQSSRHSQVTLATLAKQMLPAFLTGQYVLARAKQEDADAPAAPVGVAFWASVSDEIDQRIEANVEKPIELASNEWQSGDTVWLLDIVAPQQASNAIIKSVREKIGADKKIKIKAIDKEGNRSVKLID